MVLTLCLLLTLLGMNGIAGIEPDKLTENLQPLFQEILKLPKAQVDANHPLQMLIANVDYDDFKGKMGIGRVLNGVLNAGDSIAYGKPGEPFKTSKIAELYVFNNVGREKVESASAGESVLSVSHKQCYIEFSSLFSLPICLSIPLLILRSTRCRPCSYCYNTVLTLLSFYLPPHTLYNNLQHNSHLIPFSSFCM